MAILEQEPSAKIARVNVTKLLPQKLFLRRRFKDVGGGELQEVRHAQLFPLGAGVGEQLQLVVLVHRHDRANLLLRNNLKRCVNSVKRDLSQHQHSKKGFGLRAVELTRVAS